MRMFKQSVHVAMCRFCTVAASNWRRSKSGPVNAGIVPYWREGSVGGWLLVGARLLTPAMLIASADSFCVRHRASEPLARSADAPRNARARAYVFGCFS